MMLEKFVFTVSRKVMDDNGKEEANLPKLIAIMKEYGTVESYDGNLASIKSEYLSEYNALNARYEAIKALNLSSDEIQLINLFRTLKAEATATVTAEADRAKAVADAENAALRKQLEDVKAEQENRVAKIMAALA